MSLRAPAQHCRGVLIPARDFSDAPARANLRNKLKRRSLGRASFSAIPTEIGIEQGTILDIVPVLYTSSFTLICDIPVKPL